MISEQVIFSRDNLPNSIEDIENKEVFIKIDDEKIRKVVRNEYEINKLAQKLYFKRCEEFDKLSSYANNKDYLDETYNKKYEKGFDRIFDRLGVAHSMQNTLTLIEYLLFDECSKKFSNELIESDL